MRKLLFIASLPVLPLAALLFAQWPLREQVQAGWSASRKRWRRANLW